MLQICSVRNVYFGVDLFETRSSSQTHSLCISLLQRNLAVVLPAPEARLQFCVSFPDRRRGFMLAAYQEMLEAQARSSC
jgi:hypothetical protein